MMMVGVVFFPTSWRHVGLTDGTRLIDSRPKHGVQLRELPDDYGEIFWLDREEGTAAWTNAEARIGEPYQICATFVCECIGTRCVFPAALEERLQRARARTFTR